MTQQGVLRRDDISEFISKMYEGDLHAKRVLSLSNATLGVLTSASLAIHAVGQGLAQAMGKLSKHGVKQVDRLLSNEGIDVERFFSYWVAYMVGALEIPSYFALELMRNGLNMRIVRNSWQRCLPPM